MSGSTYLTVGVSHHRADLARLERVAERASRASARGSSWMHEVALALGCEEVFVLSTCSRTELHVIAPLPPGEAAYARETLLAHDLVALLCGPGTASDLVSVDAGDAAVLRLFRVAAGLDSRVFGEVEILTQLRCAARAATAGSGDPHRLRKLVAAAVAAVPDREGRGVLARRAVWLALEQMPQPPRRVAVVGAGTMGRQLLGVLTDQVEHVDLLSRTRKSRRSPRNHAHEVAPLEDLPARLVDADAVFVATAAGSPFLTRELVWRAACERGGRPLVLFDLSVPRNIDPAVRTVPAVLLLDLDDLADVRGPGAPWHGPCFDVDAAEAEARRAWQDYVAEVRSRAAAPQVIALRAHVEGTCLQQLRRVGRRHGVPDDVLAEMAGAVAGAVAHRPTILLRSAAAAGDRAAPALVAEIFGVDAAELGDSKAAGKRGLDDSAPRPKPRRTHEAVPG